MRRGEIGAELGLLLLAVLCAAFGYGLPGGGASSFEPGPRDPDLLRVVTWNVGGTGEGNGRALDDEYLDAIADTLRALDADLVLLLELRSPLQLEHLAAALGTTTARWDERSRGIGVLVRRGTFTLEEHRTPRPEGSLHGLYEDRRGHSLRLVGLHASPWSAARRNHEIGAATDLLLAFPAPAARLLAGDLNLDLDRRGRGDLFTNDEHLDIESYNYLAERLLDAGLGSGPTAEPDRRLDYLFVSGALQPVRVGVWNGRRVGDMDHQPLVGDFRWSGAD